MASEYPIFKLKHDYPGSGRVPVLRRLRASETMGTKEKSWFEHKTGRRVMLKFAREGTGEDWSEKLAYEIARKLTVPCPRVELVEMDYGGRFVGTSCRAAWEQRLNQV